MGREEQGHQKDHYKPHTAERDEQELFVRHGNHHRSRKNAINSPTVGATARAIISQIFQSRAILLPLGD